MKRRRLDPIQRATLKRTLRCPDCDSRVTLDETVSPPVVAVSHDDHCPALTALERQGRSRALAIVRSAGMSTDDFAHDVSAIAATLAERAPVAVRFHPYAGLHGGDVA